MKTLHNGEDPKRCPTLRVSCDDGLGQAILRWDLVGGWRNARPGGPA